MLSDLLQATQEAGGAGVWKRYLAQAAGVCRYPLGFLLSQTGESKKPERGGSQVGTSFHTLVLSRAGKVRSDCAVSWGVAVLLRGVGLGSQ